MISYLSFDPGKTTGWCTWDENGDVLSSGQAGLEELIVLCREWEKEKLVAIICEEFRLFKQKAVGQAGSTMETSQAIGIIKTLKSATGCELVMQKPNIKTVAQKWTQLKPVGDHSQSHWVDAFNHGAFYLINKGLRKTYLEQEMESKRGDV